jgi:hypothetical protein
MRRYQHLSRFLRVVLTVTLLFVATVSLAEYYKVRGVKRLDKDLYKSSDGLYIETKYCYHYTYGEDAVLKWEGKYGDNKIIWDDDSKCDVKNVWEK